LQQGFRLLDGENIGGTIGAISLQDW